MIIEGLRYGTNGRLELRYRGQEEWEPVRPAPSEHSALDPHDPAVNKKQAATEIRQQIKEDVRQKRVDLQPVAGDWWYTKDGDQVLVVRVNTKLGGDGATYDCLIVLPEGVQLQRYCERAYLAQYTRHCAWPGDDAC